MLLQRLRPSQESVRQVTRRQYTNTRRASTLRHPWTISDEVTDAIHSGKPVVALETAIYTHGFPYPDNIALSNSLESLVRENGAVPATIGILDGVCKVGMQEDEIIQLLERTGKPNVVKVSRRDLAVLCSSPEYSGGTTIAGGLVMAHLAGIKIFATGGLGGVHRDRPGETSMDISADLIELGRTPVALISSGCKSFLDIPRTLEVLETQGVGVSTFADGRQGHVDWPAFWTRESGIPSPNVVRDEKHAASIIYAHRNFPLSSGLLFANPIPAEFSISAAEIDAVTAKAVEYATQNGITGNRNTPYILSKIRELSKGATVAANKALVEANVIRGAKVAVELAQLEEQSRVNQYYMANPVAGTSKTESTIDVLVAGSVAIDISCDYVPIIKANNNLALNTSNPAHIQQSLGGVGCNVARACHAVGVRTLLCSMTGNDSAAQSILSSLKSYKMDTTGVMEGEPNSRTALYVAVNDYNKDLVVAMADMGILETDAGHFDSLWRPLIEERRPNWVVVDANWSSPVLHSWIHAAKAMGAKIAFEPVSVEKSTRLLSAGQQSVRELESPNNTSQPSTEEYAQNMLVDLATPNAFEVLKMSEMLSLMETWSCHIDSMGELELERVLQPTLRHCGVENWLAIAQASLRLLGRISCVLTKLGPKGVLQTEALSPTDPRLERESDRNHIIFCTDEVSRRFDIRDKRIISQGNVGAIIVKHHPGLSISDDMITSVNGVGDTFLGVLVASLAKEESVDMEEAISRAQKGALLTLQSHESVSPKLDMLASGRISTKGGL